jgi:NADH-quinone oxidoreductase subunit H
MSQFWIDILAAFVNVAVVLGASLLAVPFIVVFERKIIGWVQQRPGPNRTGPWGLLQGIADGIKLFFKEAIIQVGVDKPLYYLAPTLAVLPAIVLLSILPFAPSWGLQIKEGLVFPLTVASDLPYGLLFYFAITSLGVYGVTLAGWSSNNKYSLLGGVRSSAQMVSYELVLGLAAAAVIILAGGALNLQEIILKQTAQPFAPGVTEGGRFLPGVREGFEATAPLWRIDQWNLWHYNIWAQPIGFLLFLIGAFAECNRLPFDLPEAESELGGGFHTEYTGIRFALFFLAEYLHMIVVSAIMATLFFGGWTNPFATGWSDTHFLTGIVFFSLKVAAFLFFFIFIRATLPRLRYDQLMTFSWTFLLPVAIANVIATVLAVLLFPNAHVFVLLVVNGTAIAIYEAIEGGKPSVADERRRNFRYVT